MLDTMFQHLGTVQCSLFMWLGLRNLYLIKETTPYFLFTKQHVFVHDQLEDLFLKYKQYFRIPWWCVWRFLKMFLLFRSYHICEIYFQKRFWKIYFLKNICFNIFLKRIFDTNICLAYDEKAHALNGYYKEDLYPSFIHQFNGIELSL